MKTINLTSQAIQKSSSIDFIDDVIVYKQFEGIITEIISSSSVKIQGDATTFFNDGDCVLCPLKDFVSEVIINAVPSYSTPNTTLSFSSGSFDLDDLGRILSLKINITNRLVKDSIKKIQMSVEGNELNEYDSGYSDIKVDNSDKYFLSSDETGMFDNNYVFWLKYNIKFKTSGDSNLLFFGGLVDLTDFNPDFYNKTITIRTYGHSYELKRYAAYNVINEENSELTKIGGINLVSFTESETSEPGIKKIIYKPFHSTKMSGVEITRVSDDTPSGIKVLEFRYPYHFKWNNGNWYKVAVISDTTSSEGELKLYEAGGSGDSGFAIVKFGDASGLNEYPDGDDEIWVNVKNNKTTDGTREIASQGKPVLIFDNGIEQLIKMHLQRTLVHDNSGASYSDESDIVNASDSNFSIVQILADTNDELILINSERFWGADFILTEFFTVSDLDFYFSTGGETWSTAMTSGLNGLVDNTNEMKQSGKITWSKLTGWSINDIVVGTTDDYKGYMVKIVRNSATGTCKLNEIKKLIRLNGSEGDFLEVTFNQSLLLPEDANDDVIIKYDGINWTYGTWFDNLPLQYLLEQALEKANYGSAKRILSDMKVSKAEYSLNTWGKPPKFNYAKNPTAFDVDFSNETVYVAAGLEIWKCEFTGLWEYVGIAEFWASASNANEYEVKRIWYDVTYIYLYIVREYHQQYHTVYYGRMNKTTGVFEELAARNTVYGCRISQRDGTRYFSSPNYYRQIGQNTGTGNNYGENLCIPFRQDVNVGDDPSAYAMYPAPDLDGDFSGFPEWYFDQYYAGGLADNSGPIYKTFMGFFGLPTNSATADPNDKPAARFNWTFGQQGCEIIDKVGNKIFALIFEYDNDAVARMRLKSIEDLAVERPIYYKEPDWPICHYYDKTNEIFYFGFTIWADFGDDNVSYSYISRYARTANRVVDSDKVIHYNNTGAAYTDIETLVNSDSNLSGYVINEVDDAIYIGQSNKFRNIGFDLNSKSNDYILEFWSGAAWSPLYFTNEDDIPDGIVTFQLPYTWQKTSVNSSAQLWYIRIRCTAYISSDYANTIGIYEEIIWDSEIDNSGNYERYMPLWMCLDTDQNVIHGTMFNRDPLGTSNPFQWVYYVMDLNNNICYFQNTGVNFTFDGTYLLKDFVYDSFNKCIHYVSENIRYKDKPAYLCKSVYNISAHTITLNKEVTPRENEWGSKTVLVCNQANGNIFGLTDSNEKTLWEFSKIYYPRIELAKFSQSDSVHSILKYISQIMNCYYIIHSERNIRFLTRESYNGSMDLVWNENMVANKPNPGYWKHKYDSVVVKFQSPFVDEYAGTRKKGYVGWNRNVLNISNPLIQNSHIAKIIVDDSYDFFNQLRLEISKIGLIPLIQLETLDRININIPERILDIDKSKYFITTNIILESDKKLYIKILEIK